MVGIGAVEIDPGCGTEWLLRSWNNVRIDQVSDGIEAARLLGINRLEDEIEAVDADGAVGVDVDFATHEVGTGGCSRADLRRHRGAALRQGSPRRGAAADHEAALMAVVPHPRADAALHCLATGQGERHQGRRFSSDLSVDEAVLLKEIGYEPRAGGWQRRVPHRLQCRTGATTGR